MKWLAALVVIALAGGCSSGGGESAAEREAREERETLLRAFYLAEEEIPYSTDEIDCLAARVSQSAELTRLTLENAPLSDSGASEVTDLLRSTGLDDSEIIDLFRECAAGPFVRLVMNTNPLLQRSEAECWVEAGLEEAGRGLFGGDIESVDGLLAQCAPSLFGDTELDEADAEERFERFNTRLDLAEAANASGADIRELACVLDTFDQREGPPVAVDGAELMEMIEDCADW